VQPAQVGGVDVLDAAAGLPSTDRISSSVTPSFWNAATALPALGERLLVAAGRLIADS
jgi:hypothetical protein